MFMTYIGCKKLADSIDGMGLHGVHNIENYTEGLSSIQNGGDDMYEIGNMINVPANSSHHVVYLDNCQQGTINEQPYSMAMNLSGFSITLFTPYLKDNISISGKLGNNGTAQKYHGSYEYKGWTGFSKLVTFTTANAGVHHMWITDAPNATHTWPIESSDDQDTLSNVSGYNVIYIMFGFDPNTYYDRTRNVSVSTQRYMNLVMETLMNETIPAFGKYFKLLLHSIKSFMRQALNKSSLVDFYLIAFLEREKYLTEWKDFGTCIPMVNETTQFKCSGQLHQQRKCFNGTIEKCNENDLTERNLTCILSSCPIGKYIFIALVGLHFKFISMYVNRINNYLNHH